MLLGLEKVCVAKDKSGFELLAALKSLLKRQLNTVAGLNPTQKQGRNIYTRSSYWLRTARTNFSTLFPSPWLHLLKKPDVQWQPKAQHQQLCRKATLDSYFVPENKALKFNPC